jgi:hypothetical protein
MLPYKQKNQAFVRDAGHNVIFDPLALEVSIIDRSGRPIWKQTNPEPSKPIRWNGKDEAGQTIQSGDYLCRLVYADDRVSYLPFLVVAGS